MDKFTVSEKLKSDYENYYNGGSEWRRLSAAEKVANIIKLCSPYPHHTILDIGSGEGSVLARLSAQDFGENLHALEISSSAVEAIKKRDIPSLVECRLFDGYDIPYSDDRFDLVILSHVVEHLEYPRRLIRESARTGRILFIEVPLEDNLRLGSEYHPDGVGHINFYSPRTIRKLIQTCDLEILDQSVSNFSFSAYRYLFGPGAGLRYFFKQAALKAIPALAPYLWTYHCALICRKTG